MTPKAGLFGARFLTGLLGSLGHCLGMCGPLVAMMGTRLGGRRTGAATGEATSAWPQHLLFHASRVGVYVGLGAVAGSLGSILGLGPRLSDLAGPLSLALGVTVIVLALRLLGWSPWPGHNKSRGSWISHGMTRALTLGSWPGVMLLGSLNGLLPCGLVYGALLVSASAGSLTAGAGTMLAFGLGTAPALLAVGLGAGALSVQARQAMSRAAGALMVLVGLQLLLRGLSALTLVPHLRLGGAMLW